MTAENEGGAKYEPAREDGLKPFDVEVRDWGRIRVQKIYADSAKAARQKVKVSLGRYATIGYVRRTKAEEKEA